jgi:hypothetical protein
MLNFWDSGPYVHASCDGVGRFVRSAQSRIDQRTVWTAGMAFLTSVPSPTTIVGSTVNRYSVPMDTLVRLVAALKAGETLVLPPGSVVGATSIALPGTIAGSGPGRTIIDATGISPVQKMSVLLVHVPGVTIRDLSIRGAAISDVDGGNAAGIRDAHNGVGFTARRIEISDCQNGVLTFGSDISIHDSHIHDNGASGSSRGQTHNLYINGNGSNIFLLNNTNTENCHGGHEVKSRAAHTISFGCHHLTGGSGSAYDVPDGGQLSISDGSMTLPAGADDRNFVSYAMESTKNAAVGNIVTVTNVLFIDKTGNGGIIQSGDPMATLTLSGCTYSGAVCPRIMGWGTVNGTIQKAR